MHVNSWNEILRIRTSLLYSPHSNTEYDSKRTKLNYIDMILSKCVLENICLVRKYMLGSLLP